MVQRGPIMRTALLLSSLFVAACTVGEIPTNGGTPGIDGGTNPTNDGGPVGNGCLNRLAADPAHDHGAGVTHAGENCMQAGACHAQGTRQPFQFAGTLYKSDGKTASAGASIRLRPMNPPGAAGITVITDDAGNFHIGAGALAGAFPGLTDATACPTVKPMVGAVLAGGGECNSCHVAGNAGPITLADQ